MRPQLPPGDGGRDAATGYARTRAAEAPRQTVGYRDTVARLAGAGLFLYGDRSPDSGAERAYLRTRVGER